MIQRRRTRLVVETSIKGEIIISMIKIIDNRKVEEEGNDLVENVFVELCFTMDKKGIGHLNFLNAKEELIEALKARLELCMLMRMPNPHILNMLKEEKS